MIVIELVSVLTNKFMYLFEELGYGAVTVIAAMEYACLPFMPSEIIFPFIGVITAQGKITFLGALVSSIIGGLVGSIICYLIGYYGGASLLEKMKEKFPKSKHSIEYIDTWFKKYGKSTVLFTRLVPLTRTYISIIAGSTKLDFTIFIVFSLIGIAVWNTVLISLGYFIGSNWEYIGVIMKHYSIFVLTVISVVIIVVFYKARKRRNIIQ